MVPHGTSPSSSNHMDGWKSERNLNNHVENIGKDG